MVSEWGQVSSAVLFVFHLKLCPNILLLRLLREEDVLILWLHHDAMIESYECCHWRRWNASRERFDPTSSNQPKLSPLQMSGYCSTMTIFSGKEQHSKYWNLRHKSDCHQRWLFPHARPAVTKQATCCMESSCLQFLILHQNTQGEAWGGFFFKALSWNLCCGGCIKLSGRHPAKKFHSAAASLILLKHHLSSKWSLKYWVSLSEVQKKNCPQ